MKRKALFLTPVLFAAMISCGKGKKSAEDIEQEYAQNESTHNNDQNETNDQTNIETTNTSDSEYEYLEDFASLDSKTKLYETFGSEFLMDGTEWYAEGTVQFQVTTYYDPNTLNEYRYVWNQEDNETLAFIEVYLNLFDQASGTVRQQFVLTEAGVFTGMTIKELYDWNEQQEIRFSGFGWDFGGGVFPDEGSKLAKSGLSIRLGLDNYADETYNKYMGDMELSTSTEGILEAPIRVDMLTIYKSEPEM